MKSIDDLLVIVIELKKAGKKIVSTNGCFDILHKGHVTYLEQARALGDVLVVGINSDESVKRLKGKARPFNTAEDRAVVLAALKSVDHVFVFNEDTPVEFLKKLKPHIHAKGGDYTPEKMPEYKVLKDQGAELAIIPFVDGYSTTNILSKRSS